MMISLEDQTTSVAVALGERVTVRVEESAAQGLLWGSPRITGSGLQLVRSTSLGEDRNQVGYREFVFSTHKAGRNLVTVVLKQVGMEVGIKTLCVVVDVLGRHRRETIH